MWIGIIKKALRKELYMSGRLSRKRENQRPLRPERSALPGCATARYLFYRMCSGKRRVIFK